MRWSALAVSWALNPECEHVEGAWDPDAADTTYTVDYAYLLRNEDGSVRVEHDRHIEGLFSREDWMRTLAEVGFETKRIPFDHLEIHTGELEVFLGRRPG